MHCKIIDLKGHLQREKLDNREVRIQEQRLIIQQANQQFKIKFKN